MCEGLNAPDVFFLFLIAAGEDKRPKGECFGGTRLNFRDAFPVT